MDSTLRLVFPLEGQVCSAEKKEKDPRTDNAFNLGIKRGDDYTSSASSSSSRSPFNEAAATRTSPDEEDQKQEAKGGKIIGPLPSSEVCVLVSSTKEVSTGDGGRRHLQSLLLQACVTACQERRTVLFISTRAAMDESLFLTPETTRGEEEEEDEKWSSRSPVVHRMKAFQRSQHASFVRFVFPKTGRELCTYLAALGAVAAKSPAEFPDVILINSCESFFAPSLAADIDDDVRGDRQEESAGLTRALSLIRHLAHVADAAGVKPLHSLVGMSPRYPLQCAARMQLFADEVWGLKQMSEEDGEQRPEGDCFRSQALPRGGDGDGNEEKRRKEVGIALELFCVSLQPVCRIRFKAFEQKKKRRRKVVGGNKEEEEGQFRYYPVSVEQDLK